MVPDWVAAIVANGLIAEIGLGVIAAEAIIIGLFLRRRVPLSRLVLTMAAGFCLLAALQAALTGGSPGLIAAWLVAAFAAHAADMLVRVVLRP